MKHHDDITPALWAILRSWSTGDAKCWISFSIGPEKLAGIDKKWTEELGTRLSTEKRRWLRNHCLPTAWAVSAPVLGKPHLRQVILMASEAALSMSADTPWGREKWITRPPEFSDFVMVHEPRDRRDYAWTWRIQNRQLGLLEQHLTAIVKTGNGASVAGAASHLVRFYPMFGGVRRQLRRLLNGSRKLWVATHGGNWPGPDPESLPMMIGFRAKRLEAAQMR